MDAGDVYLADLGHETSHPVVVLPSGGCDSGSGKGGRSTGAVVGPIEEVQSPWRIAGFAVDTMKRSPERLLTQTGRVESEQLRRMLFAARQLL